MKTIYLLPAALLGLALAAPAHSDDKVSAESRSKTTIEKDDDGSYKKKQSSSMEQTDKEGTTSSTNTKLEEKSDAEGNSEKKVTTETATDPKGLMNKEKTVTTDSVKYKDGKLEKKYQKKVNGKTVEENSEETKSN